ncbi:HupE/UreJ family protein [Halomicronema sp. CCY15110]|uniref:HupE/UreJ family protein n=1 Tax=Halomicronema sp. CCY15110 TaxID=2767773 RepID=UPI001EF32280|nr:HupE/UreJ family protein [Halomicronema sp. CCY15110]
MRQFWSIKAAPPAVMARVGALGLVVTTGLMLAAAPALAHHPFGGDTPTNAIQGFLSGMGHPVIGLDHLAFVIAAGLLAAAMGGGLLIPVGFVVASMAGTGLHLMAIDLPAPEFIISASVLLFGVLLAMKQQPKTPIVIGLAALAGLFHGYAYGEAVVGAGMDTILAYLAGFAVIQLAIAVGAYGMAKQLTGKAEGSTLTLRFAGFALAGVGAAFLSGVVLG